MDIATLKKDIQSEKYYPVYLLHGEERFFIEQAETLLEANLIEENAKSFDQFKVYGADVTFAQIRDQLTMFPMLGPRRAVFIREAQTMDEFYQLESYVARPIPSTVLVLSFKGKKVDKRKKFYQLVKDNGWVLESEKLDDKQIMPWLQKTASELNLRFADGAPEALVDLLGKEVSLLYPELIKLQLAFPEGTSIQINDILDFVGMSREYNVFELKNAMDAGQREKAMKIGAFMAEQKGYSIIPFIALLAGHYSNLYAIRSLGSPTADQVGQVTGNKSPYVIKLNMEQAKKYSLERLEYIISQLHEYDMKSKGWNNPGRDDRMLTIELLDKILYT